MTTLEYFFLIMLGIQLVHSIEELSNKFYKEFPLFPMTFKFFLSFEVIFLILWTLVYFIEIPFKENLMAFFILLMFINGIWHITWYGIKKKYVPGIITAPLFIIAFIIFYFQKIF
ncbi:MAG: HXXEE domain-containing protein [Candidatus Magasanikbacteria bacterium]|jgi:hypothetical protein|nr:HXXEE domain-containing protein [Candidatus Magasanikbacteria bacterium]MBT4071126.1 HXXEE domain-containing protein [Candidatus Magasanikbacteria bacterium]